MILELDRDFLIEYTDKPKEPRERETITQTNKDTHIKAAIQKSKQQAQVITKLKRTQKEDINTNNHPLEPSSQPPIPPAKKKKKKRKKKKHIHVIQNQNNKLR